MTKTAPVASGKAPVFSKALTLATAIKRGETEIASLQVRKPSGAGELRGLKLSDLLMADVDQHLKLLPRLIMPNVLEHELAQIEPQDFTWLVNEAIHFLTPK